MKLNPPSQEEVQAHEMAFDAQGNMFVTGHFNNTIDFGGTSLTSAGQADMFLASYTPAGQLRWVHRAGSITATVPHDLIVDNSGNAWVSGYYVQSTQFGATTLSTNTTSAIFVAKYDNNGNLQWAVDNDASGASQAHAYALDVDDAGNGFISGTFASSAIFGSTNLSAPGDWRMFIAKINSAGTWQWAMMNAETGIIRAEVHAIDVHTSGEIYVTGRYFGGGGLSFAGSNDTLANAHGFNDYDIFLAKFDGNGNYIWAEKAGNSGDWQEEDGNDLYVDANGDVYLTGIFADTARFGNITLSTPVSFQEEMFLAKYNSNGTALWANHWGPILRIWTSSGHKTTSMAVDQNGIYITGNMNRAKFGGGTLSTTYTVEAFVNHYDLTGNLQSSITTNVYHPDWHHGFWAAGTGIALDASGTPYVLGTYVGGVALGTDSLDVTPLTVDTLGWPGDTAYFLPSNWFIAAVPSVASDVADQINSNEIVTLYPNPTPGTLNIITDRADRIRIVDLQGRLLLEKENIKRNTSLDLSSLSEGVYFLQVERAGERIVRKVVKR